MFEHKHIRQTVCEGHTSILTPDLIAGQRLTEIRSQPEQRQLRAR